MAAQAFRFSDIDGAFEVRAGFPRPNWNVIVEWAETLRDDVNRHELWTEIAAYWLSKLADTLKNDYAIWESQDFMLLCSREKAECERLIRYCEKARKQVLGLLGEIASDGGFGKLVVLLFHDAETYFDYVSDMYPDEGEFGGSGGMFIRDGYSHIVILAGRVSEPETAIAHELSHCFLAHLDLPLWLDEGVTQLAELEVAGRVYVEATRELAMQHRSWWNSDTIQDFWRGGSFSAPDDRQELSYSLAKTLTNRLMDQFPDSFEEFVKTASVADAGDAALWKACCRSLSQCVSEVLGNQDWSPRPASWIEEDASK